MYECMAPYSFKFYSCTGTSATDWCDVQSFNAGHPFQRGKSTYAQVMGLLPRCHLQTPAEAQADARSALAPLPAMPASNAGPGGFKVGDSVRILSDGWQEAKVMQVHGTFYVVQLPNGISVSKQWPMEVRRVGKLAAEDHAAGQYDRGDRVQVLVSGRWMEGEAVDRISTCTRSRCRASTRASAMITWTRRPRISACRPPEPPARSPHQSAKAVPHQVGSVSPSTVAAALPV